MKLKELFSDKKKRFNAIGILLLLLLLIGAATFSVSTLISRFSKSEYTYAETVTQRASCTEEGTITYVCNEDESKSYTEEIPVLGHVKSPYYTADETGHWHACLRCGEQMDYEAHTIVEDPEVAVSCETDAKTAGSHCSVCEHATVPQKITALKYGHSFAAYVKSKNGKKATATCKNCGHKDEREVAKIIVLAGQSNAVGYTYSYHLNDASFQKYKNGFENIQIYYSNNPYLASEGTKNMSEDFVNVTLRQGRGGVSGKYAGGCFGPEIGIAEYLSEKYPNEKFFIIKDATGGTTLYNSWYSPSSCAYLGKKMEDKSLYTHLVSWVDDGAELLYEDGYYPEIVSLAWMQGESDSRRYFADYSYLFANFVNDLTGEWAKKNYLPNTGLSVIQGGITDYWNYYDATNLQKSIYAELNSKAYYIDVDGSSWISYKNDNTDYAHHDADSMVQLGRAFGEKFSLALGDYANAATTKNFVWNGADYSSGLSGAGTQQNPYLIQSMADMAYFARSVKNGNTYAGKYIKLTTDLNMANPAFTGIGSQTAAFAGNFDGDGHTVQVHMRGRNYMGLFAKNTGTIRNVTVDGLINSNYITMALSVGGIAGYSSGTVENCVNKANVYAEKSTSAYWMGGIVGYLSNGTVVNCTNYGTVGTQETTVHTSGGIVGYAVNDSIVQGCKNNGNVYGSFELGGIVGYLGKADKTSNIVVDCSNSGKVQGMNLPYTASDGSEKTTSSYHIGGIAGTVLSNNIVQGCSNSGEIVGKGSSGTGGVAGIAGTVYVAQISACANTGKISNEGALTSGIVGLIKEGSNATGKAIISACTNDSDLTSNASYVGGIVGHANVTKISVEISNCSNTGDMTGVAYVGGIIGKLGEATEQNRELYISECSNTGNILATGHVTVNKVDSSRIGGIAGMSYGKLTLCESTGTVRSEEYDINADTQAGTEKNKRVGLLVGYKTSTCSIGDTYTWKKEILKPATCQETGIREVICVENSSKTYQEVIELAAHAAENYTHSADGKSVSGTCETCGVTFEKKVARVIVLSGQSNAVGRSFARYLNQEAFDKYTNGYENIKIYYSNNPYSTQGTTNISSDFVAVTLGQGSNTDMNEYPGGQFGPEIGIAEYLSKEYPDEEFFIIKDATGASYMYNRWYSPSSCEYLGKEMQAESLYTHLVDWVDSGMELLEADGYYPEIFTFAWMQGESDSSGCYSHYTYLFNNFIHDLTTEWSAKNYLAENGMAVIQGGITDYWTNFEAMNRIKELYAETHSKGYFIDVANSDWLSYDKDNTDYAHHDAASMATLGNEFGKMIVAAWEDRNNPAVTIPVTTWDGLTVSDKLSGTGSKDDPYLIQNESDMAYFAKTVCEGNTYEEKYVKLKADIDMSHPNFKGVGDSENVFAGEFDGNGHAVTVYIRGESYLGLFAKNSGVIKDVTVKGSVSSNYNETTAINMGGIAGYNTGTISGCTNEADLYALKSKTRYHIGGIAGYSTKGTIENCKNTGAIGREGLTAHTIGGIIGKVTAEENMSVKNCENSGDVYGSFEVGGIVGRVDRSGTSVVVFEDCKNVGNITGTSYSVGGIAGLMVSGCTIQTCENTGAVSGKGTTNGGVAGIVGKMYATTVKDCKNSGQISNTGDATGGIAGLVLNANAGNAVIMGCENYATIQGAGSYVGGIVGYANVTSMPVEILNCINGSKEAYADITGEAYVGGIIGKLGEATEQNRELYISECSNTGNILATGHVTVNKVDSSRIGGIAGMSYGKLTLCESTGAVRSEEYDINADTQAGTEKNKRVGLMVGYKTSTCSIGDTYTWKKEILKPATCQETGIREVICVENSSKTYQEVIELAAHVAENYTHSADGKSVSGTCEICGVDFEKKVARVIVLSGQSNAVGHSFSYHLEKDAFDRYTNGYENIKIYYSNYPYETNGSTNIASDFVGVTLGQGKTTDAKYDGGCFGPEVGIAEYLSEKYPGEEFFIIKDATGATRLHNHWYSPSSCEYLGQEMKYNSLYTHLLDWVDSGMELLEADGYYPEIFSFAWMQGESDSTNYYGDYTYLFNNFINDLTKEWSAKNYLAKNGMAVIQGGITDYWTNFEAMNRIKELYAETHSKGYFIDVANSDWVSYDKDNEDYGHHDVASMAVLGNEFGKMIAAAWEDRDNPAVTIPVTTWDGLTVSDKLSGTGSKGDPYLIQNESDMAYFAKTVCEGNTYEEKYVKLKADIDMSHPNFKGVGDSENVFAGEFDGNGHAVTVYIRGESYLGLFAKNSGVIKDVTVKGSVSSNYNETTAINMGGIAGYNAGTISGCTNEADIYALKSTERYHIGGIVGYSTKGIIENCKNTGTIGKADVTVHTIGGIIGEVAAEENMSVKNCENSGNVYGSFEVGGILGKADDVSVEDCSNTGNITAANYVGGIVGYTEGTLVGCSNSGNIEATTYGTTAPVGYNAGGIAGRIYNASATGAVTVEKSNYSIRKYTSASAYTTVTGNYTASVLDCSNSGQVKGAGSAAQPYCRVGGIVGSTNGAQIFIGCSNSGEIIGYGLCGGILGYSEQNESFAGSFNYCYQLGNKVRTNKQDADTPNPTYISARYNTYQPAYNCSIVGGICKKEAITTYNANNKCYTN